MELLDSFKELRYTDPEWCVQGDDKKMVDFVNFAMRPVFNLWTYWWLYGGDHE